MALSFKICYPEEAVEAAKQHKIKTYHDIVDLAVSHQILTIALEYRTKSEPGFPYGIVMGYKTMEIDKEGKWYTIDKYLSHDY